MVIFYKDIENIKRMIFNIEKYENEDINENVFLLKSFLIKETMILKIEIQVKIL